MITSISQIKALQFDGDYLWLSFFDRKDVFRKEKVNIDTNIDILYSVFIMFHNNNMETEVKYIFSRIGLEIFNDCSKLIFKYKDQLIGTSIIPITNELKNIKISKLHHDVFIFNEYRLSIDSRMKSKKVSLESNRDSKYIAKKTTILILDVSLRVDLINFFIELATDNPNINFFVVLNNFNFRTFNANIFNLQSELKEGIKDIPNIYTFLGVFDNQDESISDYTFETVYPMMYQNFDGFYWDRFVVQNNIEYQLDFIKALNFIDGEGNPSYKMIINNFSRMQLPDDYELLADFTISNQSDISSNLIKISYNSHFELLNYTTALKVDFNLYGYEEYISLFKQYSVDIANKLNTI